MSNKQVSSLALFLVLLQMFLLFLPIARTSFYVSSDDWYGNQSAFQMIGDYENVVMIGELRQEWGPVAVIFSAIACLGTLGLISGALLCLAFALMREETAEYQLPLLRNASCFLCGIPVLNFILQYIILAEGDGYMFPTVFGILLMIAPLGFIPLFKKITTHIPETTPKPDTPPSWQRFVSDEEN